MFSTPSAHVGVRRSAATPHEGRRAQKEEGGKPAHERVPYDARPHDSPSSHRPRRTFDRRRRRHRLRSGEGRRQAAERQDRDRRAGVPGRRQALRRALLGLPQHGHRRCRGWRAEGQGPRARGRPELQRPQGGSRQRPLRDPQRRLLRGDHAPGHRGRQGGGAGRRLPGQVRRPRQVQGRSATSARPHAG